MKPWTVWLAAVWLAAAAVAVATAAAAGCGGSTSSQTTTAEEPAVDPAVLGCVEWWNGDERSRRLASVYLDWEDAYVSVGLDVTFPDRCLVTIASPSFGRAVQFLEGDPTPTTGSNDSLPAGIEWNATAVADDFTLEALR